MARGGSPTRSIEKGSPFPGPGAPRGDSVLGPAARTVSKAVGRTRSPAPLGTTRGTGSGRPGGAESGGAAGRPRPEKVVAADGAECVEHLAAQEQAGVPAALHRPRVNRGEAHPAAGHLGLLVPFVPPPRQLAPHQHLD